MTFTHIGQTALTATDANLRGDGRSAGKPTSGALRRSSSEIAQWLCEQSPVDVTRKAVSQASSLGVKLQVTTKTIFPKDDAGNRLPMIDMACGCDVSGNRDAIPDVIRMVEATLTPAPVRSIEVWLVELSAITAGKRREGIDATVTLNAYSGRLREYPADVARAAVLEHRWKWFPTWDELARVCDALAAPRRHMLAALKAPPVEVDERREATAAEKAEIKELVETMFPNAPKEWRDAAAAEAASGACMTGGIDG